MGSPLMLLLGVEAEPSARLQPRLRDARAFTGPPYHHTPAKHVTPASNANMTSLAIVII
jgi:hypothetical protein